MNNKFLVYTSNLDYMPKNMADIIEFAKSTPKFYISNVELNSTLKDVKAGDNIITKKGNSIYVIRTFSESLDNLNEEDQAYIDDLARYSLKKMNITSVSQIIKFETWCKSAKVFINKDKVKESMETKNSIKSISSRLKELYTPQEAKDVRIAHDGNICVATTAGFVAIDGNNKLISYPEEFTFDLPVYIMAKPQNQLQVGDIVALDRSYAKVTKIEGEKISAIGYTGAGKVIHTIKDFLFNQTTVRVVVSLAGNLGGQINPMMLLLASKDDNSSLLPFLMMNQQGGALGINPMVLYAMSKKGGDKSDLLETLLLTQSMGGVNPFAAFTTPVAPAKDVPEEQAEAEAADNN